MNLDALSFQLEQEFPKIPFTVEQVGEVTKVVLTKRLESRDFARFAGYLEKQFGGKWVSLGTKSHFKIVNQPDIPDLEKEDPYTRMDNAIKSLQRAWQELKPK